jgi:hypothetical protein
MSKQTIKKLFIGLISQHAMSIEPRISARLVTKSQQLFFNDEKITCETGRKTAVNFLKEIGVNVRDIAKHTGHECLQILSQAYIKTSSRDQNFVMAAKAQARRAIVAAPSSGPVPVPALVPPQQQEEIDCGPVPMEIEYQSNSSRACSSTLQSLASEMYESAATSAALQFPPSKLNICKKRKVQQTGQKGVLAKSALVRPVAAIVWEKPPYPRSHAQPSLELKTLSACVGVGIAAAMQFLQQQM